VTIRQALSRARQVLAAHHVEDSPLESEILLRHALSISRVELYSDLDRRLTPEEDEKFWQLAERRLTGEPSAYITGHREFYGFDFYVDPGVLIPRPETELLVERAIALAKERSVSTMADIGTGCGAIAISLAVNLPGVKIYATDTSAAALEVARLNCQKYGVADRVRRLAGNLLDPLSEPVDLILANLPYVRERELSRVNTRGFEPSVALDGGPDGLEKIRRLCHQAEAKLNPGGSLLLEIGMGQKEAVTRLLRSLLPKARIEVVQDLSGRDRVVTVSTEIAY
jgi:release factor glutamine methyltransferase